jgi:hypothetical protein
MENLSRYRELIVPDIFGGTPDDDNPIVEDFGEEIYSQYGAEWRCGASKMCIIPSEGDMVIKLPFMGNMYYDDEGSPYVEEFEHSGSESCTWDYCLTEVELYNKIAAAGFECFLARTEAYGKTHSGHPMYIQEKVEVYGEGATPSTEVSEGNREKSKTIMQSYRNYIYHSVSTEEMSREQLIGWTFAEAGEYFIASLIEAYGYDKVADFSKWVFLNARNLATDLHWGNIGYRKSDGTPCLLDFTGFFD